MLEILAGIPTVVYGYFAALTVAPLVRDFALSIGMENPSTESALAAGLVMGVMIIPFVSSMADDAMAAWRWVRLPLKRSRRYWFRPPCPGSSAG